MPPSTSLTEVVLASSFYIASLEQPFVTALSRAGKPRRVTCVPYNQLQAFLLDPFSVVSEGAAVSVLLFLRVEDFIRLELTSANKTAQDSPAQTLRRRSEEFLEVLRRLSRLNLTLLICPSSRGAHDVSSLENEIRILEHKIAAELRRQQRHLIIGWREFEELHRRENIFSAAGDRLGHVPFSPHGLDALAEFLVARMNDMPATTLLRQRGGESGSDLSHFLAGLKAEMALNLLTSEEEEIAVNLLRHTTHFVNWPDRKWQKGDIKALASRGLQSEGWAVRVRDRFGDYGISGALTFAVSDNVMEVGLLFLTCPVLGKQVEYAFLAWIAALAEERRLACIEIPFTAGRDNQGLARLLAALAHSQSGSTSVGNATFNLRTAGLVERILSLAPHQPSAKEMFDKVQSTLAIH